MAVLASNRGVGRVESHQQVIAVDLGGTHIRVAAISASGEMLHRDAIPTNSINGPDSVISRMGDLINRVAATVGVAPDAPVGVASPGPLDARTGTVLYTPNLPGWRHVRVVERLGEITGRTISLANDGNCGALGEARFGSAQGVDNLVYLALGTGVGGGVISGGHLVDGVRGLGAEVGHVVIAMDGPRCSCGQIGCLESFVAGWAIKRDAEMVATTAEGETLVRTADGGELHAGIVAEAARAGDPAAKQILARVSRALGAGMGAFANLFTPNKIVIGGGVADIGMMLLEPAIESMANYSFVDVRGDLTVGFSSLGQDTGLYGAAALALGYGA
jgi:glucokinase